MEPRSDGNIFRGVAKPGELPDVSWYDLTGETVCWDHDEKTLTCLLRAVGETGDTPVDGVLLLFNAEDQDLEFVLPEITSFRLAVVV